MLYILYFLVYKIHQLVDIMFGTYFIFYIISNSTSVYKIHQLFDIVFKILFLFSDGIAMESRWPVKRETC